ncbi:hypothetical protein HYALB_00006678 [Hymenoscyphus albidus]|uniref:Ion transport domain-containing protein n=1 Tax=Hymenoscyphus albidus TaxID=595503 RepID=A0A9N9Q0F1_9HELO|nr:hypothetical protein HYALB_00006678 [Hymenoscyphus albidus]
MLSSLLRPKKSRQRVTEHAPFSSSYPEPSLSSPTVARRDRQVRHATADWTETEPEDDELTGDDGHDHDGEDEDQDEDDDEDDDDDEDGEEDTPLLPIFSAAHLDALPIYNLTHAIRVIVLPRTETTLTWDQLRSPQVSQFLVKPMLQQLRAAHFSRATLYALMANCLQFQKEAQANPGNAGVSRTRALVCELLAIKLLKEYSTRELIDALSYDFFPLQGIPEPMTPNQGPKIQPRPAAARTSTVEVAIRASAKSFLAHPLVVQQLEAIWAGTIVFHSAADNLHRKRTTPPKPPTPQYKNNDRNHLLVPGENVRYGTISSPGGRRSSDVQFQPVQMRRTVTLYDPRDASLFKLSRLRVPRYRQFFSTFSLAILLGLFVAVLSRRSMDITLLEVVFWFWSAGFMLDEVVGFNEQGFSLYIMSFWNTFDLGILLFLIMYYSMRLYGLFLVDIGKHEWNSMAYDVLATTAILLFPRLFSVLDHYRYFSQLLIAFRLMAIDLVAVFVLILIACSGFFVAFTMSFRTNGDSHNDAAGVAYKIFQILMGFTPAAWDSWSTYNPLGKAILVLFLFICHFLVVTILITVLTNSFMKIVSNANEEHQFVFAVNTISMVKNDALFSYVAPSNIIAWVFTPLRFILPFRSFIKLNRTVIKITHFPLLFSIFAYEKLFLASSVFEPTDLIDHRGRKRLISFQENKSLFSPNPRTRQESVAGFQKDRALDEVFRLAPRSDTLRNAKRSMERRQKVVNNWMEHQGEAASPPQEQDRSVVDRLETRRQARKATMLRQRGISGTRSVASDPADFMSSNPFRNYEDDHPDLRSQVVGHEDDDGDDELVTNEDDEGATLDKSNSRRHDSGNSDEDDGEGEEDYFTTPNTMVQRSSLSSARLLPNKTPKSSPPRIRGHNRNMSSNTILYNPVANNMTSSSDSPPKSRPLTAKRSSNANTGTHTPTGVAAGHRTPKHSIYTTANTKARPIMPNRADFKSVPNFDMAGGRIRQIRHKQSSLDMGMSDLGWDNPNQGLLGAVPSSFGTQMARATGGLKDPRGGSASRREDTEGMMGRLMLARMKTLEEGFAEVVKEFRGLRTAGNSSVEGTELLDGLGGYKREKEKGKGKEKATRKKRGGKISRTTSELDFAKVEGREREREQENVSPAAKQDGGRDDTLDNEGFAVERFEARGSSI